jgi:hypothetical protein
MMHPALRLIAVICASALALSVSACAAPKKRSTWDDIDYSKVRNRSARENDGSYIPPSVVSCMDDDLFNCR